MPELLVKQVSFDGHRRWALFVAAFFLWWSGCTSHERIHEKTIGDFGRIVLHRSGADGFVIGVAAGTAESGAVDYAEAISDSNEASLIVAHGFKAKRIPVIQPLIHTSSISRETVDWPRRPSVYAQFKEFLQSRITGPLRFYVGVHVEDERNQIPRIEVISAGFALEQLNRLKEAYTLIRDELISDRIAKVEIALDPLDGISVKGFGIKNHGVLMLAEKGLILRIPPDLTLPRFKAAYVPILTYWIAKARAIAARASSQWPEVQVKRLRYGRMDLVPSRKGFPGIVIGAPHGSFDWYTAELVQELSYRTELASVVTRGFTPTECDGWRINVNRPTERRYPTGTIERKTDRAREVYEHFSRSVFEAARGPLNLYLEMHQNSSVDNIDVATHGITQEQAKAIKSAYYRIRDRVLREHPGLTKADFSIEPLDQVAIGAWGAKEHGMLRVAHSSLHFELPAHHVFYRETARRAYTRILVELIDFVTANQPPLK